MGVGGGGVSSQSRILQAPGRRRQSQMGGGVLGASALLRRCCRSSCAACAQEVLQEQLRSMCSGGAAGAAAQHVPTLPTALAAPVEDGMMLPLTERPPLQSFLEGPSTVFCVAVAACTVVIRPSLMPQFSLMICRGGKGEG